MLENYIQDRLLPAIRNGKRLNERSPSHDAGFSFNNLNNNHLHVDTAGSFDVLADVWNELDIRGKLDREWKIISINDVVVGPQATRPGYLDVYQTHNPGSDGGLEYVSTFDASVTRDQLVQRLRDVLAVVSGKPGVAFELERVIGRIKSTCAPEWVPNTEAVQPITAQDVNHPLSPTMPFEIHHGFDIPKADEPTAPLKLEELNAEAKKAGLDLGGWFLFESPTDWAYRSNCFVKDKDSLKRIAVDQDRALKNHFRKESKGAWSYKTVIERVLGVWNIRAGSGQK